MKSRIYHLGFTLVHSGGKLGPWRGLEHILTLKGPGTHKLDSVYMLVWPLAVVIWQDWKPCEIVLSTLTPGIHSRACTFNRMDIGIFTTPNLHYIHLPTKTLSLWRHTTCSIFF